MYTCLKFVVSLIVEDSGRLFVWDDNVECVRHPWLANAGSMLSALQLSNMRPLQDNLTLLNAIERR